MNVTVGADIESICSKCGDVWHVVVAKVGDQIAKVQCKQCGGYHRYRSPNDAKTSRAQRQGVTSRQASPSRSAAPAKEPSPRFKAPAVEPDLSRPVRPYQFKDSYQPGDRIEHPKFGLGVVEITSEPGKMQVFFADGRRVLALAKAEGKLERPRPFDHDAEGKHPI